jgi:post-segregation antitoxin (ccd killing protein)
MASGDDRDLEAMQTELQALRQQRWTTGKEAVDAIKAYASDHGKGAIGTQRAVPFGA